MSRIGRQIARQFLQSWGRLGKAPGWRYRFIARFGHLMAEQDDLKAKLPNGCEVTCDLREHIQRQIYFQGSFEPIESSLFTKLLRPGMTVVDAGANVGQYTLLASTAVGPTGRVLSFEPIPKTYRRLEANVLANGLANVRLNRAALWSEKAQLTFGLDPTFRDNMGTYSAGGDQTGETASCEALPLDDYLAAQGIERVDFLKMDIEGAELFALRGMKRTLQTHRPLILAEINRPACQRLGYDVERIGELLLGELGYRAWLIRESAAACRPLRDLGAIELDHVIFHQDPLPPEILSGWDLKSILRQLARTTR